MTLLLDDCCRTTIAKKFGLCDDNDEPEAPAYFDTEHGSDWIATILNRSGRDVNFFALDHCASHQREDGSQAQTCDAAITIEDDLLLFELKTGTRRGWFREGMDQLLSTIRTMDTTGELKSFDQKRAYISNSWRPRAAVGRQSTALQFYHSTGFLLYDEATVDLDVPLLNDNKSPV